jgi:hypothetical protein
LTEEDILHTPQFGDIAALLLDVPVESVAIPGRHVRFDRQFMECEFSRLGQAFPFCLSMHDGTQAERKLGKVLA